jgi:hypothetical protein
MKKSVHSKIKKKKQKKMQKVQQNLKPLSRFWLKLRYV